MYNNDGEGFVLQNMANNTQYDISQGNVVHENHGDGFVADDNDDAPPSPKQTFRPRPLRKANKSVNYQDPTDDYGDLVENIHTGMASITGYSHPTKIEGGQHALS
ncbi:hypothetical protein BG015_009229 [Linnemannia schmuckeri]|uniref:Uncharacterized protein n=1 Tax=Linnemannia schmuckeri TaxID=64567 RepID=A0A9P5V9R2_9FUNG|nr:hypothetical protein BG015_009229 [Linnemannia schmuckeri]